MTRHVMTADAPIVKVDDRTLDIAALGETSLIRSARNEYTGSWYVREPRAHAGVAAFKAFGAEGAADTYTFELVAMGTGGGSMPL